MGKVLWGWKKGRWAWGGKSRLPTHPATRVTQQSLRRSGGGGLDKTTAWGHEKCLQELPMGCQWYLCKCKADRGKERAYPSPLWGSSSSGVPMHSAYGPFWLLEITALSRISTGNRFWNWFTISNYWVSHTLGFALDCTCCSFPNKMEGMLEEPLVLAEIGQCSLSHQCWCNSLHISTALKEHLQNQLQKTQANGLQGRMRKSRQEEGVKREIRSLFHIILFEGYSQNDLSWYCSRRIT